MNVIETSEKLSLCCVQENISRLKPIVQLGKIILL